MIPFPIIKVAKSIRSFFYLGSRFYCPLCNGNYRKFLPAGIGVRPNARCPGCNSLERHRLFWIAYQQMKDSGKICNGGKMLHVAPEPMLSDRFQSEFEYISGDLDGNRAMTSLDITDIGFPNDSFDAIVCHHVLEHVPNDRVAIEELYRVLKLGGWGSISVPMFGPTTVEDYSITDPKIRQKLFGQKDHVRQYGLDFLERLKEIGFTLTILRKPDIAAPKLLDKLSVDCEDQVSFVFK